ncbi:Mobile element protein [Candidatus Enterovibrio altilux]|uniref:Mobile element protein n=1 Tax=Candidatus Enterovibrio altilux TaxID=1927128 RepID=A0A291B8Q2_9GAMM|nr:Mobile element protein [Candidatus Enterovibrio luxaltus]
MPLSCPHYSWVNKQDQTVNITFKMKIKSTIKHLTIDTIELKIYGEGK